MPRANGYICDVCGGFCRREETWVVRHRRNRLFSPKHVSVVCDDCHWKMFYKTMLVPDMENRLPSEPMRWIVGTGRFGGGGIAIDPEPHRYLLTNDDV